jgi:hypothetical protein
MSFQGLGLPSYLWYEFVNLLLRTSSTMSETVVCSPTAGGKCVFTEPCTSLDLAYLWDYSFYIQFDQGTNNTYYNIAPLAAFAVTNNDTL